MSYFHIVATVEQDKNDTISTERTKEPEMGLYAYAFRISENENIVSALERIGGLKYAQICPTKKRAEAIAQFWNDSYRANGSYLFDTPSF